MDNSAGPDGFIEQGFDGGYITSHTRYLTIGGNYFVESIYIIKSNAVGDTLWTMIFDGRADTVSTFASKIQRTNDKCYLIVGSWADYPTTGELLYLLKIDTVGNVLWNKVLMLNNILGLNSKDYYVDRTYDNGFIIHASNNLEGSFLIKVDSVGDPLWVKSYNRSGIIGNMNRQSVIHQTSDSGYIMLSRIDSSYFTHLYKFSATKLDNNGNIVWSRLFIDSSGVYINNIYETWDNGFILCDGRNLIKLSVNGDTTWTKAYDDGNENLFITGFAPCKNGDWVFTGTNDIISNCVLFKTDSIGRVLMTRRYICDTLFPVSVRQADDNGFLIFGRNYPIVNYYFNIVKTDSNGFINCNLDTTPAVIEKFSQISYFNYPLTVDTGSFTTIIPNYTIIHGGSTITNCFSAGINEKENISRVALFPNPSTGKFHLKNIEHNSEVKIFNLLGKIIYQSSTINSDSEIDLTNQPKGIYFCNIISKDNFGETIKIILQ